jgi:glycosyltransferase involved in cell wall biosynthesis
MQSAAAPQNVPEFGVNVIGFVSARLGLGVAARASVAALVQAGVSVAVVDLELPDGRSGYDRTWTHLQISDPTRLPYGVNLVHVNPPEAAGVWQRFPGWFASAVNLGVPFFELAELPSTWYPHLSRYDAILAPSEHIAAATRNALPVRVRHYPIAADVQNVAPLLRAALNLPEDAFAFVTTWDTDSGLNRKNGVGALRAFAHAFADRPDVVLVLKVNGIARHPELEREIAAMRPQCIRVVDRYLPYHEVLGLYAACDAFVSLHRAEGLALGLMEAMLLGKPVVTTGWSGNMDFMDDASASLVRYTLTPVLDTQAAYAPGQFLRPQLWAEPDLLHAAELMRRLVADPAYYRRIAEGGRNRAEQRRDRFFSGGAAQTIRATCGSEVPLLPALR